MALNVSSWSIRRPLPSVLISLILLILGWVSFNRLPITRLPSADIPLISVVVAQFGSAPAEIEAQVTKTVEDGVAGVEGVRHITSLITDGVSVTTIAFRLETNTDRALNDVKDAVTRIRSSLPRLAEEPLIQRVDVVGLPILTYAAISPGKSPEQLSYFVDTVVKRQVQSVRGVAQVETIGGVEREVLVSLDPDRIEAYGLTAVDVSRRLRGTNVDVAGGRTQIGGRDHAIRTLAGARTLDELSGLMLALPSGNEIRLRDLGTVTDTVADRRTFASLDAKPVVAFGIKRAKGASDVVVAKAVQAKIDAIKADYPDVQLSLIDTSVDYTVGNYEAAIHTLFEGAALAVIVVFLFLRDLRTTIIVAVSLPLSIFPAFWAMDMLGFSLNLVSFLAVTLSTGILVDDSIVEIENIVRHIRMGKSPYQAAIEAADEIGLAVIAISFTIVAIFAPASFMSGIAGQFFKQFGITVAVQVMFSLLAARFVTPVLAAYLMKGRVHVEKPPNRIERAYVRLVTLSVRHYGLTVLLGIGLFAASIASMRLLSEGFLPAQDTARSLLSVELPPGSQASDTQRATEAIVADLKKIPEVRSVFVDGGRLAGGTIEVRRASLILNYTDKSERKVTQRELEQGVERRLQAIPDIRYWFVDENGLRAVSLVVTGADSRVVASVANELANQMRRLPTVANVVSGATLDRPELRIRPRLDLATKLGITADTLSETIRVATIGDVGPALAKFDAGDRLVPVRVQLDDGARENWSVLEGLRIPIAGGRGTIPLAAVADLQLQQGPANIGRYDRERQATVAADLVGTAALGDVIKTINALPVMRNLPRGIRVSQSGDAENLAELSEGFADAMRSGLMMVYAVLVLLFGSFLQPITILFSLPLSIGGAVMALLVTGKQLTTPVWIGILMLMGIVTKNAIMLVDFAIESIRHGQDREAAIIDAGRKRARPIVMTTIAMVAGMMPSALAIGAGGEFRSPMATAVIGGLLFSTILSLIFVPAIFVLVSEVSALPGRFARGALGRLGGRLAGLRRSPRAPPASRRRTRRPTSDPAGPMRRLAVGLALLLAVALAAGAALLYLAGPRLASNALAARLAAETGLTWAVAADPGVEWSPPAIVLRRLDARAALDRGATARLEAAMVRVLGAPIALVTGERPDRIEVEGALLRAPAEWWRYRPDARTRPDAGGGAGGGTAVPDLVVLRDGALVLAGEDGRDALNLAGIAATLRCDPETGARSLALAGRLGDGPFEADLALAIPDATGASALDLTLRIPRLREGLRATGEVTREGAAITVARLAGTAGGQRFGGALALDLAAKPSFRLDLNFPSLALATDGGPSDPSPSGRPDRPAWRLAPADLDVLRYVEGRARLHAGALALGRVTLADVGVDLRLTDGEATATLAPTAFYGGTAGGGLALARRGEAPPRIAARLDLAGVRALPFLTDLADATLLEGTFALALDVAGQGWDADALLRTLAGRAVLEVRDGRLRALDLPSLARAVAAGVAGGLGRSEAQATAFDRVGAGFAIRDGRAATEDLALSGPLVVASGTGTIDLPGRTLAVRLLPKFVGAGGRGLDLGVPVVVEGPWGAPNAYPDLAGAAPGTVGASALGALDAIVGAARRANPPAGGADDGLAGLGSLLDALIPGGRAGSPGAGPSGPGSSGPGQSGRPSRRP